MESAAQAHSPRNIAHLDMDAFYASVELLRYPQLRGRPVVVGGRRRAAQGEPTDSGFATLRGYTGRGVITTSTYEARALGVFSGMGLMKAAKLAPDAILLPTDFETYRRYSRLFKAAVLTPAFDLANAPQAGGYFLGDYQGLAASSNVLVPVFVRTTPAITNRTDVFALFARSLASAVMGERPRTTATADAPPVTDATRARASVHLVRVMERRLPGWSQWRRDTAAPR